MDIWKILDEAVERHGSRPAILSSGEEISYSRFRIMCIQVAVGLAASGVEKGDRVAVLMLNAPEYMTLYYAAAALGAVLVPVNHRLSSREVAQILDDSEPKVLVAQDVFEKVATVASASSSATVSSFLVVRPGRGFVFEGVDLEGAEVFPASVEEDDPAHIYYTSGTTGRPKGVVLTHRNVCTHAASAVRELVIGEDDVWIHAAPMFHLADAWAVFSVTMAGGAHVIMERFEPGEFIAMVDRHGLTITNLIPTMLNLITRHPALESADLSSLRLILSGGAPIAREVVKRTMDTLGCDYVQTYGMTETSPFLTLGILPGHLESLPEEERLTFKAKTGRPFSGVALEVVDEAGQPVSRDAKQVGEIRVKGDTVTPGYWRRPEETARAFRDGWLLTGDLAVWDQEGFVDIVDRKKDMIITGGENVYSTEVESVLYEHPAVLEAAVFGVDDERWGERVTAAVVLREGFHVVAEEIISFCKGRLAGYKSPKEIRFLDGLPRTGSGKISKRLLKEHGA